MDKSKEDRLRDKLRDMETVSQPSFDSEGELVYVDGRPTVRHRKEYTYRLQGGSGETYWTKNITDDEKELIDLLAVQVGELVRSKYFTSYKFGDQEVVALKIIKL